MDTKPTIPLKSPNIFSNQLQTFNMHRQQSSRRGGVRTTPNWNNFEMALLMVAISLSPRSERGEMKAEHWEWAASWMNSEITRRGLQPFRVYDHNRIKTFYYQRVDHLHWQWCSREGVDPQAFINNLDEVWARIDPWNPWAQYYP